MYKQSNLNLKATPIIQRTFAEETGLEPARQLLDICFQDRGDTNYTLLFHILEERKGFEPLDPVGPPVFKTGAIGHSATSPKQKILALLEPGFNCIISFNIAIDYDNKRPGSTTLLELELLLHDHLLFVVIIFISLI